MQYDVFISHAWEDKEAVVRPLYAALEAAGAKVWVDELQVGWGDSLSSAIDRGLAKSRYGIVVLSKSFFAKRWTQWELQGLVQRQVGEGRVVILPLYFDVTNDDVRRESPSLADQFALEWSMGPDAIAERFKPMLVASPTEDGGEKVVPVGGASMVSRVKSLIQGGQQIPLHDLLSRETDAALASMSAERFDLNFTASSEQASYDEFRRRMVEYESAVEDLSAAVSTVAYFGGTEHHSALRRVVERLGDAPNDIGNVRGGVSRFWLDLCRYPAMLVFHRTACAAIAAPRWENLRPLLREAKVAESPLESARVPMLSQVRPHGFTETSCDQWLVSDGPVLTQKLYTPVEDYLASRVATSLAWFGLNENESDRIFDTWLFLAHIAYLGIPQGKGRWDSYFSSGRWWRVHSVFRDWDRTPQAELVEDVRRDGDASPVLRSGVAPDAATLLQHADITKDMVLRQRGW